MKRHPTRWARWTRVPFLALGAWTLGGSPSSLAATHAGATPGWEAMQAYCTECHNGIDWAGGLSLDALTEEDIPANAQVFEQTVRKLRGRLMPPPGSPQPDASMIDQYVAWMETRLDALPATPRAGHVPPQRLNRTEYAAMVRDLLGVEINPRELLPPEVEVDGFDNIAVALGTTPTFLDQYLNAARTVARLAVGDPVPKIATTHHASPGGTQDSHVDGLPLGTRGGYAFRHFFPADGEYRFTVLDLDLGLYPWSAETRHALVLMVDGQPVFRGELGGPEDLALVDREAQAGSRRIMQRFANIPVQAKAGTHEVVVTFIERSRALNDEPVASSGGFGGGGFGRLRVPRVLDGVTVSGPYNATGLSPSPRRARLFVCEPGSAAAELPCARRIAGDLARRAYRRPVTDADVDRLMPLYELGRRTAGGFDAGIQQVVAGVLASPDFLYRAIRPARDGQAAPAGPAGTQPLSDLELASRLSFFLWSTGPDEALLAQATAGRLRDPQVLEREVRRMLADPRARALVDGFALRWLNLDDLDAVDPDRRLHPTFTPALREDFSQEIRLFLQDVLLEDRSITELLDGRFSFLNERLARHYGIEGVYGPQFRRVELQDERRFGLLGKGATLLRTSYGDRTSPVLRGAWVLERLLGTPTAPPPPGVETDLSTKPGQKATTQRARLEQHRDVKGCNSCHGVIDPIGLALDNFDVTGRWREIDAEANAPVDASTVLPTGVAIRGPVELRRELMKQPAQFATAFTEKLLMYAIGREVEYHDMPQVRQVVREAGRDGYRFSAIVLGIVRSDAFRLQSPPHEVSLEARHVPHP